MIAKKIIAFLVRRRMRREAHALYGIADVLVKYALNKPLSLREERQLQEWCSRSEEHRLLPDQLRDPAWHEQHKRELAKAPSEDMWRNISEHMRTTPSVPDRPRTWYRRWLRP